MALLAYPTSPSTPPLSRFRMNIPKSLLQTIGITLPVRAPAREIPTRNDTWAQEIFSMGNLHNEYFLGPSNSFLGRATEAVETGVQLAEPGLRALGHPLLDDHGPPGVKAQLVEQVLHLCSRFKPQKLAALHMEIPLRI